MPCSDFVFEQVVQRGSSVESAMADVRSARVSFDLSKR